MTRGTFNSDALSGSDSSLTNHLEVQGASTPTDRVTVPVRRAYQFGLRTCLLMAIPLAFLAWFASHWFPPTSKKADPSPFVMSVDSDSLESVFQRGAPTQALMKTGLSASDTALPQSGHWQREFRAGLVGDQVTADQAMRSFRLELEQRLIQNGGRISKEKEKLAGSSLVGFRFSYVQKGHSGLVEARFGPEKPYGAFPEDPPYRQLKIQIVEWFGSGQDSHHRRLLRSDVNDPWQSRPR